MRCVWVPHPELHVEYKGREKEVLAGKTGEGGQVDLHQVGRSMMGGGSLGEFGEFPYEKFGIVV